MTLVAGLALSAIMPLLAGLPWLLLSSRRHPAGPGSWPLALGYGYALGLLIVCASMATLSFANLPISLIYTLIVPSVASVIGWWRMRNVVDVIRADCTGVSATWRAMNRATRAVCMIVLALIAIRLLTLGIETLLRPAFPWEAVSAISAKARVWYELRAMAPFVSPAAWLEGIGNFTDADAGSLALPSLLQVWTANAVGQWHEGSVGFAWWMLAGALLVVLYGHVRRAGGGMAFAMTAGYAFISLPLVDLHIALAGAPQWIAAAGVGLAGCAVLRWLDMPTRDSLLHIAIGAALALCSMVSTWPWFVLFGLAIIIRTWPHFARKLSVAVPLLVLLGLVAMLQTPLQIGNMSLRLQIAAGWAETLESLFLLDNWHLLYGAALLVAVAGRRFLLQPEWLPRTWIVAMGIGLLFVWGVLSLPGVWYGGLRDFSYVALQFAPVLVLWTAITARAVALYALERKRDEERQADTP